MVTVLFSGVQMAITNTLLTAISPTSEAQQTTSKDETCQARLAMTQITLQLGRKGAVRPDLRNHRTRKKQSHTTEAWLVTGRQLLYRAADEAL